MSLVSPDLIEAWRRDGAVLLKGALEADEVSIVKDAFEYHLEHLTPWTLEFNGSEDTRSLADLLNPGMWETPQYKRLWNETKLLSMAAEFFTAPDIWLLYEQIFFKQSSGRHQVEATPWHQDLAYDPVEGRDLLRFWTSLEPLEKGFALEFVRGSHLGPVFDPKGSDDGAVPSGSAPGRPPMPDINADRSQWDIMTWAMEPGDVLAFHPAMLHGGAPTKPNCTRRTLTMLLFGRDARYAPRPTMPSDGALGAEGTTVQDVMNEIFEKLQPGEPAHLSAAPRLR